MPTEKEAMAHLLFLSTWCPIPADNGSKLRIFHLIRELGRHHEIDLLAFAREPLSAEAMRELHTLCASIELVPEAPFANRAPGRLRGLLSTRPRSVVASHSSAMAQAVVSRVGRHYDLVIASELHMAPYALLLPGVPRLLEDIELALLHGQYASQTRLGGRVRYGLMWWKTRRYIAALLRQFATATVVSEQERMLVRSLVPDQLRVANVPNGVDTAACAEYFGDPDNDTLIYPGALSYQANFDAMAYFLSTIWPHLRSIRPNVRLRITGRSTPEQIAALPAAEGVTFTGFLNDVRPAIAQSWAEIVPLRVGGGTRLKILEALALGTPVVATSKGVEGLDLENGRHILVADTAADFAQATAGLLADPGLRARLAAAGRQVVCQQYDWQAIGQQLHQIVSATLADHEHVDHVRASLS